MPLPARAQVVVVGAGLAGLSAAVRLRAAGVDVHVAEAARHAGGRLATERIDGFVVDRGFQVLNTGYPRAADLDLAALDLGWFWPGAVVRVDGRASRVVDPRRRPAAALDTVRAPLGSPLRKAAIAAYSARAGYTPVPRLLREPETTAEERLRRAGVGDTALERFFRPFLAGVLLFDNSASAACAHDGAAAYRLAMADVRVRLPLGLRSGVWESLAIRLVRDQEGAGSNPAAPTRLDDSGGARAGTGTRLLSERTQVRFLPPELRSGRASQPAMAPVSRTGERKP